MKDYSQNGEQKIILDYFGDLKGKFLSLGENDGETLSNVRALALNGWIGTCVEPVKIPFDKLNLLYDGTGVQCLKIAIGETNGVADFYESGSHLKNGDHGLLSTLLPTEVARWRGTEEFTKTEVEVVDVPTLMSMCAFDKYDMISCDIEGLDLFVLGKLDFVAMETKLVIVEYNGKDRSKYESIMFPLGFKLIHNNFENLIFAK